MAPRYSFVGGLRSIKSSDKLKIHTKVLMDYDFPHSCLSRRGTSGCSTLRIVWQIFHSFPDYLDPSDNLVLQADRFHQIQLCPMKLERGRYLIQEIEIIMVISCLSRQFMKIVF